MVGDDLTVSLFFAGVAVTLAATGITQAGWRHWLVVVALFLAGVVALFVAFGWPWLKGLSPAATGLATTLGTSPVAWFVTIILALSATLFFKKPPIVNDVPASETPSARDAQKPRTEDRPVLRGFAIGINPIDQHAYVSFIPTKDIPWLRVCLDQSRYTEGIGVPPAWTPKHRSVLRNLQDLTPGVRYTVAVTSMGERQTPPDNKEEFLKWEGTNLPIAPSGLYRGRVALIPSGEPEIRQYFLAAPFHHENLRRAALQIIDKSHFSFVEEWEAED
jgi:hypothetical protein